MICNGKEYLLKAEDENEKIVWTSTIE